MAIEYGFFCGGDPRKFNPDVECCSEGEILAHALACDLWNRAESRGDDPPSSDDPSGWMDLGFGVKVHVLRAPYGVGTYEVPDKDEIEFQEAF